MQIISKKYIPISEDNVRLLIESLNQKVMHIYTEGNYDEDNEYVEVERKVFEPELWGFGEQLYKELKKKKKILEFKDFHFFILSIINDKKYRTSRQRFVLLLEDFKLFDYHKELIKFIDDPDIYGHVLSYLVKGKIQGYKSEVENILLTEKTGWIKKLARKYLELY